jgi:hypothetical protein
MNYQDEFENELKNSFPTLGESVEDNSGLLHVLMGSLYSYTQEQITRTDWHEVERIFRFIDNSLDTFCPKEAFENAVSVSFLEYFDFRGHEKRIRSLFGPRLEKLHDEQSAYMKELARSKSRPVK